MLLSLSADQQRSVTQQMRLIVNKLRHLYIEEPKMSNPAETYESYMVPVLFAPWAARLIQSAKIQPHDRVLDIGCGTGIVARLIASTPDFIGTISGLDVSPHMLAVARAKGEQQALKIDWHEGRVESMPFQTGSYDLVVCQQALQFFADRKLALAEIHRVLSNDGRFVFSVWQGLDRHPFYKKLHSVIYKRFGMSGVETIFELRNSNDVRSLIIAAGFRDLEVEQVSMTARFPDPAGFLAGEIDVDTACIPSMQHLRTDERQRLTADIRDEMAVPLREVTQNEHVVMPFHANIFHAIAT
jgi:ubiquinone/menaquinone biosynthesis C-methylase UbiE